MLEDFRLKVFVAVAQERSFTKAAAALGISQPAVSQNVAEIEKSLGVKCFERLKGETVLTTEGEIFHNYAAKMLALSSKAADTFAKLPPATVRISASEELYTYMIEPALETFVRIHPGVIFERSLFDDVDLKLSLRPSEGSFDYIPAESIARIRMSIFPTQKMGDLSATHEKTSYFDVIFQPSSAFACTRLCRMLKDFLIS